MSKRYSSWHLFLLLLFLFNLFLINLIYHSFFFSSLWHHTLSMVSHVRLLLSVKVNVARHQYWRFREHFFDHSRYHPFRWYKLILLLFVLDIIQHEKHTQLKCPPQLKSRFGDAYLTITCESAHSILGIEARDWSHSPAAGGTSPWQTFQLRGGLSGRSAHSQ